MTAQKISPFLWFSDQAEEAAGFYVSLFADAEVTHVTRSEQGGPATFVSFTLEGVEFMALNGGTQPFTEATSLFVRCTDQAEVDRLWSRLTADGGEESMCGWLKDRFGVSWQIIPDRLGELLGDPDPGRSQRAMQAMLQMRKIDVRGLEDAANASA